MSCNMTKSEAFVFEVCRRSFLSLWSYANPQGKGASKELCDILVVCEPDVIIVSVKDIKVTDSGDLSVDRERWRKRATDGSVKQIYGAERYLERASNVIRSDGTPGRPLPSVNDRRIVDPKNWTTEMGYHLPGRRQTGRYMSKRKTYTAAFKAKVVLALLREEKPLAQGATEHEVPPS